MRFDFEAAFDLARDAALNAGASEAIACSLARATVEAERAGNKAVGFAHLVDYLDSLRKGRIARDAEPVIHFPAPAMIAADANRGIAQLGFDRAFDEFVQRANTYGVTVFSQSNSYTTGELGYYTRRLAQAGLVALATSNADAQVTTLESRQAVFSTNPLSFAAPLASGKPFVIDQASSATAFVNVRRAAEQGEPIPEGWAIDANGLLTTDAREAVKGLLLTFGGYRGANIALINEIFTAGMTGGNWSMDAPSFCHGDASPSVGLFIIAIMPDLVVKDFPARLQAHLERLASAGLRIPGTRNKPESVELSAALLARLSA
jgi:(2R)-3-sulfolactate dehydrogenase (NADP+)